MKKELIQELFARFEQAAYTLNNVECWSARELQILLGYSKWENFVKVIDKAKDSCSNAGEAVSEHFPDVRKMIEAGKWTCEQILLLSSHNLMLPATFEDTANFEQTFFKPTRQCQKL